MYDTDVLIVGAGPTGLAMALELAIHQIPFRLVEKEATRSDKSRALVVQARTQELLSRYGDAETFFIAKGKHPLGATVFVNKKMVADINLEDLEFTGTRFPLPLLVSQVETEDFLETRLKSRGHMVERSVVVTKIEQDENGASATLSKPDGTEEHVRCRYIVGCDGAHSTVRHSADMAFEGSAYTQEFILADIHIDWAGPQDRLIASFAKGFLVMLPLNDGLTRLVFARPDQDKDINLTVEFFQDAFDRLGPGKGRLHDPTWLARFRLHHRGVDKYRDKRLFVAGDAAHIHSPVGGQGMNTGIQDSINLAWKLARVLRGEQGDSLLDSYHDERWPIGQELLHGTDQVFRFAAATNPVFLFMRNSFLPWFLRWYTGSTERSAAFFMYTSELGVAYRNSRIVGTAPGFRGPIQGGDRVKDGKVRAQNGQEGWLLELCKGPSHHILIFSGTGSQVIGRKERQEAARNLRDGAQAETSIHSIPSESADDENSYQDIDGKLHALFGFQAPGLVLVRPDGYVGYIGQLSQLGHALDWLKQLKSSQR